MIGCTSTSTSISASAIRRDVLAKCYSGVISRRKKLLMKAQAKEWMNVMGKVDVPQEAFVVVLKLNDGERSCDKILCYSKLLNCSCLAPL